jgi:hypothetical protein
MNRDKIIHYALLLVPGLLGVAIMAWPTTAPRYIGLALTVIAIASKFVQTPSQKAYVNELESDLVAATQNPSAPAIARADSKRPPPLPAPSPVVIEKEQSK